MSKKRIGLALCGSYCTYEKLFAVLGTLCERYDIVPIMSETAASTDSRFGTAVSFKKRLFDLTGREPVCTIADAEPLGPSAPMDALVIAPCTGNTMAKLAHGVTDTAVTMAAKAHLRNGKPLVIAFSTNDGLTGSAPNIAALFNRKNVYLVPYKQDDFNKKPYSLASDFKLLPDAIEAALEGRQLQPIIL